jgi:hypothetical protein
MTTLHEKIVMNFINFRPMIVDHSYADGDIEGNLDETIVQDFQEAKDLFLMLKEHRPEIWNKLKKKMGFEEDDSIS